MQNNSSLQDKIDAAAADYTNPRMLKILLLDTATKQAIGNSINLQGAINQTATQGNKYGENLQLLLQADNGRSKLLWVISQAARKSNIQTLSILLAADKQRCNLLPLIAEISDPSILQLLINAITPEEQQSIDLQEKITNACMQNKIVDLRMLLELDNQRSNLRPAIEHAYKTGNTEIFALLLEADNYRRNFDLQDAIDTSSQKILLLLLESIQPNEISSLNVYPSIKRAVHNFSPDTTLIQLLLKIDNKRSDLTEEIIYAVKCQKIEVLQLLLKDGKQCDELQIAIDKALWTGCTEKLKLLLTIDNQHSNLQQAIESVSLRCCQYIQYGSLTESAKHIENLLLLLQADNGRSNLQKSIDQASNYGCIKILELLEKERDMKVLCNEFPNFCRNGSLATLALYNLISHDEVVMPNPDNETYTELFNKEDSLVCKAGKAITYCFNVSPLSQAISTASRHECLAGIVPLLQQANSQPKYILVTLQQVLNVLAANLEYDDSDIHQQMIKLLLLIITPENMQSINLQEAIYHAVKHDHIAALKLLLKADNQRSSLEKSITYHSGMYGNIKILKLLLEEDNGRSDLQAAIYRASMGGGSKALQLLLQADNKRSDLQEAIYQAVIYADVAVLTLLLQADNQRSDLQKAIKAAKHAGYINIVELLNLEITKKIVNTFAFS